MGLLFGTLGLPDGDRTFVNTIGQRVVFDAVQRLLEQYRADLAAASAVFVEGTTEDWKFRYKLPGGGRLQRRGGQGQSGAIKAGGQWDVAFPLEDFGAQIAGDRVSMAYMRVDEMDRHISTVQIQDTNTVRWEILRGLLANTARTFEDETGPGTLVIQPLANGDSVKYPPIMGSEVEATADHYLVSGYAATAISDTNNPFKTIADRLEARFGAEQGGSNIVAFINPDETPETEALTDFDPVNDRFTTPGVNTDQLMGMPQVPGRIIGRVNGCWVSEWRFCPSGYIMGVHLDAPKPLLMRVDPADTGLGRGLQLVAEDDLYPFKQSHWAHRFGVGVGNRLNGMVIKLAAAGSYEAPAAYAS